MFVKKSLVAAAMTLGITGVVVAGPASTFSGATDGALDLSIVPEAGASGAATDVVILSSALKVPGAKKDLLIGVSLESSLMTKTKAKGKNGEADSETACGTVGISVEIDGVEVSPGAVNFNNRCQTLNTVLGGVIEECNVSVDDNGNGVIDVSKDCTVTDEEIELILETTSANHFNFIAPNVGSGEHTIEVLADVSAMGSSIDSQGSAVLNVGSLTVEVVRSANTEDGITTD